MSNSSKSLYDSFINEDSLQSLINEKITEGLYLEFKKKEDASKPALGESDRANFSEILSQFANSDGGVVIFGVHTEKPNDAAAALKPITNPEEFLRRLLDFGLLYATHPGVDGVVGKVIMHDGDSGYAVFHIPSSFKAPHRSVTSREYYKRGQNGKYRLEHIDLEDMFGRRQKPHLLLQLRPKQSKFLLDVLREDKTVPGYLGALTYDIFIANEGRYVGKNCMAVITGPVTELAKIEILPSPNSGAVISDISDLRGNHTTFQISTQSSVYYPEVGTRIATLYLRISINSFDTVDTVPINWVIYAEDMASKEGVIQLNFKDLISSSNGVELTT